MYSPQYAIETDREIIDSVIEENPFATLVFRGAENIQSFHLPLHLEGNTLVGHMARANHAWRTLDQSPVLIIFHGPHCYISPDWYGGPGNVPTWNYISVQVRGNVRIFTDLPFLRQALIKLGQKQDPNFDIEKNINDHQDLLVGIVGIEVTITDIFAKFKLAQSKNEEERANVIKQLQKSSNHSEQMIARAMQKTLESLGKR